MARPKKAGLDYFPFDVDFFSDKKIKRLRASYGSDGVAVYIYMLCEIYRSGYYVEYDDDLILDISDELNITTNAITQILNHLFSRSLLVVIESKLAVPVKIITAASVQRRFQAAKKGGKREVDVAAEFWVLKNEETESFIKVRPVSGYSQKNDNYSGNNSYNSEKKCTKESKVKESKVKESKKSCRSALSAYGSFNNVLLSEDELEKLKQHYPNSFKEKIERLSFYMESSGTVYKNHFAKLVEWLNKDNDEQKAIEKKSRKSYNIDELEKINILDDINTKN